MQIAVGWIAVAVGIAGTVFGFLFGSSKDSRKPDSRIEWTAAGASVLFSYLLYLLSKLSEPPFAAGERLGLGILLGGVLGSAAGLMCARAGKTAAQSTFSAVGAASAALLGAGLVLQFFPGYPQPAAAGFAAGAILSAVLFNFGTPNNRGTEYYAIFAASLCASIILAVLRYDTGIERLFWRAPLVIAAAAAAACLAAIGKVPINRQISVPSLIAAVIIVALSAVFSSILFQDYAVLQVTVLGIAAFALAAWLPNAGLRGSSSTAGAALGILAFSAIAFKLLGGFGIGIGIIAAWVVLIPALAALFRDKEDGEKPYEALTYAGFFAAGVLVYRLFLEFYGQQLRGPDFREHYTFVALLLGAMMPFALRSFIPVCRNCKPIVTLATAGSSGIFAAAVPLVILAIWGFKAALAILIGTTAAELFILFISASAIGDKAKIYLGYALYVLGAQWALLIFAGLIGPVSQNPRIVRVIILASAAAVWLVWSWIASRLDAEEG